MAKQQTEDELNIKRKARRRLVGAIALALAVVVILPMVLDSEPKTTGQDIDLRIPAADKAAEFVPGITLSEVVEAAPVAEPPVGSGVAAASDVLETKPLDAVTPVAVKKNVADVKPLESKSVELKKTEAKPIEIKPAETKKPDVKAVDTKPAEAKSGDAAALYAVQIGAFSNADTAKQEAEKLRGWGYKAYTEIINGTTRVRIGPYQEREKAETVIKLLEKHGLHPAIKMVDGHAR